MLEQETGDEQLEKFPWCGHGVLMGGIRRSFQDDKTVLKRFGNKESAARAAYGRYLQEGIDAGSNDDPLIALVRKSNEGTESPSLGRVSWSCCAESKTYQQNLNGTRH